MVFKKMNFAVAVTILSLLAFFTKSVMADELEQKKGAYTTSSHNECQDIRRYTFSWPLLDHCDFAPRGGTSVGAPVTFAKGPSAQWLRLMEPELTPFERDRQAILAMAGAYRASFEFLETMGYTPDFIPSKPYQSWGTEFVYVVEDRKEFISLQHIMVMFVMNGATVSEPIVMKHWRQDWQYQKTEILAYVGDDTWQKEQHPSSAVQGTWAQAVYQVDDSPRYESFGRWQHFPNFSTWRSAVTWRPLPRREHTVRNDYQVLEGYNRHTILPDGWSHEEENYKVKLDPDGRLAKSMPYLAKELGVNRYQRIVNFDFSAGDDYWRHSGPFWREVRQQWQDLIKQNVRLRIQPEVDGVPLHSPLFERALLFSDSRKMNKSDKKFVKYVLGKHTVGEVKSTNGASAHKKFAPIDD